jgi:WD40 repeat protein
MIASSSPDRDRKSSKGAGGALEDDLAMLDMLGETQHRAAATSRFTPSDLLDISMLKQIKSKFTLRCIDESGDSLKAEDFIALLAEYVPKRDAELMYKKIDVNNDGKVEWHEFTGFLINADSIRGINSAIGSKASSAAVAGPVFRPTEKLSQASGEHVHRDMIEHIAYSARPYPIVVTGCRDGSISLWNAADLSYITKILHVDKNTRLIASMVKNLPADQRGAMVAKVGKLKSVSDGAVMLTSFACISATGHLCVGSADFAMTVYDLMNQEICGRLDTRKELITSLQAGLAYDKRIDEQVPYILMGGFGGTLSIIKINEKFGLNSEGGAKKRNQILLDQAFKSNITSLDIHKDTITQVMLVLELDQYIASSMDGRVSLTSIDNHNRRKYFSGHAIMGTGRVGVKVFSWVSSLKYICSAGSDRLLLLWDPYTLDVLSRIDRIQSSVLTVGVSERHHQLIVVTEAKIIRCWDSITFEMLELVEDSSTYHPSNQYTSSIYIPELDMLVTAGNKLKYFAIEKGADHGNQNATADDTWGIIFNEEFHHVIVLSNSGIIKVFDSNNGSLVSQFDCSFDALCKNNKGTVDSDYGTFVKCACLDHSKRRLIIVSVRNEVQLWNCHNGCRIDAVIPRVPLNSASLSASGIQITCLLHGFYFFPSFIQLAVSVPSKAIQKRYVMLGLECGVIVCLHDSSTLAEDVSIILDRSDENAYISFKKKMVLIDDDDPMEDQDEYDPEDEDNRPDTSRSGKLASNQSTNQSHQNLNPSKIQRNRGYSTLWIKHCTFMDNTIIAAYSDGMILFWDIVATRVIAEMNASSLGASFSAMKQTTNQSKRDSPEKADAGGNASASEKLSNSLPNALHSMVHARLSMIRGKPTLLKTMFAAPVMGTFDESLETEVYQLESGSKQVDVKSIIPTSPIRQPPKVTKGQSIISKTIGSGNTTVIGVASSDSIKDDSSIGKNNMPDTLRRLDAQDQGKLPVLRPSSSSGRLQNSASNNYRSRSNMASASSAGTGTGIHDSDIAPSRPESQKMIGGRFPHRHSMLRELFNEIANEKSNSIFHAVVSPMYRLLFGVCADGRMRIWDIDSSKVLCSCELTQKAEDFRRFGRVDDPSSYPDNEAIVSYLVIDAKSMYIVVGYDNSLVRCWALGSHSTGQIRTVSITETGESAIPPMQFLSEWSLNDGEVMGLACVHVEPSTPHENEVNCFILTCGQSRGVSMWTVAGALVGIFGVSEWLIDDRSTWRPRHFDLQEQYARAKKAATEMQYKRKKRMEKLSRAGTFVEEESGESSSSRKIRLASYIEVVIILCSIIFDTLHALDTNICGRVLGYERTIETKIKYSGIYG